jgi:hypothetical protein
LNTKNLFNYIKVAIKKYITLGETNLIILVQGDGSPEQSNNIVNIGDIYKKIKNLNYNFKGEILIMRVDKDSNFYIYEVYPNKKIYKKMINYKKLMTIEQEIVKTSLKKVGL